MSAPRSFADIRRVREEWVDDIQTACRRTGTAFFFKQWAAFAKIRLDANIVVVPSTKCLARHSRLLPESCDRELIATARR